MSKKLFVDGISWGTSEDKLNEVFGQYGEIEETKIITDRETGRSRGFGFVTFVDGADADNAIQELNGTELDGRNLNVNEARERAPRSNNNYGGGGGGGYNRGGGGGGGYNRGGW